jgi:hypothetical protein
MSLNIASRAPMNRINVSCAKASLSGLRLHDPSLSRIW